MCVLCGVLLEEHWAEREGGRRGRALRVGLVNRVLGHFGLHLDDWSGRVYVLRDRKGHFAVVENLGALWSQAELLAGRPLDPLDPELLAYLAGGASRRAEPGSGAPPGAAGGTVLSGPVPVSTVPSGPAPPATPQEREGNLG